MDETRAPVPPAATSLRVRRAAHRSAGHLEAYRLVEVSWYGGGGSLACGGSLTSFTMGVANRTLPCGTRVTLRYHGRTMRVRVIDRGPYVAGREYDLTEATARALGFEGVGEMGVRVSGSSRRRR
ncbi:MAG: RlpA-like double-psi beta-barrel domain-containing protein [Solirubrobacterales bacterium]